MENNEIELPLASRNILNFKTKFVANEFGRRNLCPHNDLGRVLGYRNKYYGTIENPFYEDFKAGFLILLYDEEMAAAVKSIGQKKCLNDMVLFRNHSDCEIIEGSIKSSRGRLGYRLQEEEKGHNKLPSYFSFFNAEKNKNIEVELTSDLREKEDFFYVTVFGLEE